MPQLLQEADREGEFLMAWELKPMADGKWEYFFFNSAYGAAGGIADTLAEAKVRLAIVQADVMENPYPPAVVEVMLADPERFAGDFPSPKETTD